ncbi:molybdopterin-dependent oxidoreductase [Seleniivibrio sp.]|uniref:molybdopterin-containing oxidoreductase family protein n=1 Tax=Seleniivibrio sp. TaxID=2898801 RepID=UPI0025FB1AF9|nr:molybdopterin-dependent oxidoreductase [Seleniivibrio sp.]MCD8554352.1 molybdopterin-dependent oxidoreductase [Seleniivibrio sp.]
MTLSGMNVSRRKFLAASGGVVAAGLVAANLSTLKAVASGHSPAPTGEIGEKHIASSCEMCVNKCGFFAHVVDGRLKKLNPNPKFFKSRAMLCARGNAGAEEPYNPERLTKPLLRVGERGEGKWKEISYEEAFKLVAEKLKEFKVKNENRSSVAFASSEGFQEEMFQYLVQSYGSTNTVRHPTLCLSSVIQGWSSVYGVYPDADLKNSKFVIMFGANRAEAIVTPDSIDFVKYKPEGAKLIYLDPRFTNTATKADKWYPVKPGTDLAFVLGVINVIITEKLYDAAFVEQFCDGFADLETMIAPHTPEWAEKECEIPAVEIRWVAREFAKAAPAAVAYPGRRTSWYVNDVYFRRACAILTAICGCWDAPGGICPKASVPLKNLDPLFPYFEMTDDRIDVASSVKNRLPQDKRSDNMPTDSVAYLGEKDGSWLRFRDAIIAQDPYPVEAMIVYKQNFIEAVPNRAKTMEMLKKIKFMAVIDIQMTEVAYFADLVIPESTYLERWDSVHNLASIWPIATFRQPVVEPVFGTKSMFEIAGGIINEMLKLPELWDDADEMEVEDFKMDVAEDIFGQPLEEYIKHQLADHPGAYEQMMKEGVFYLTDEASYGKTRNPEFRFKTRTGKIELANVKYADKGLSPLPIYAAPRQPEPGKYRMILGRHGFNTHTGTQNNEYLWEIQKENVIWINTAEARKIGVISGDYVTVKSSVGEQTVKVFSTEKIRKDCVFFAHGFGRLSPQLSLVYKKGASQAAILEDYLEPISGNAAMHETFVSIAKA